MITAFTFPVAVRLLYSFSLFQPACLLAQEQSTIWLWSCQLSPFSKVRTVSKKDRKSLLLSVHPASFSPLPHEASHVGGVYVLRLSPCPGIMNRLWKVTLVTKFNPLEAVRSNWDRMHLITKQHQRDKCFQLQASKSGTSARELNIFLMNSERNENKRMFAELISEQKYVWNKHYVFLIIQHLKRIFSLALMSGLKLIYRWEIRLANNTDYVALSRSLGVKMLNM